MWVLLFIPLLSYATRLKFLSPSYVRDDQPKGFSYNIADFGFTPYGKSLHGTVHTVLPADGCTPVQLPAWDSYSHDDKLNILFVDRGNCSFITQAFNAEQAGASMLIIGDTKQEDLSKLLLISDHTKHVQIPVIMLAKNDSDYLRNLLLNQSNVGNVVITVTFKITQTPIVNMSYFMSSKDAESYQFIRQFFPFYKSLKNELKFTPRLFFSIIKRYVQYWCYECAQQNWTIFNDQCLSGGRYCAPDPDGSGPLLGRDVIYEDIRQLCIFQNDADDWWHYERKFYLECIEPHAGVQVVNLTSCSLNVIKELEIDRAAFDKCMSKAFDGPYPLINDSKILSDQRLAFHQIQFPYWPSLLINDQFYKGDLYFENQTRQNHVMKNVSNYAVLEAVCASFTPEALPTLCDTQRFIEVKEDIVVQHPMQQQSSSAIWFIVAAILIAFMGIAFLLYRRTLRREVHKQMQEQVQNSLDQYYKYEDKHSKENPLEV